PPGNDIANLALDGNRLWVTTVISGVGRLDLDTGAWRTWPATRCTGGCDPDTTFLYPFFPLGLLVDGRGRKWVGSWTPSIDYLDDATEPPAFLHLWHATVSASDTVKHTWMHAGAVDSSGEVWLGMDTPGKGEISPIGLDHYRYGPGSSIGFVENFNQ